MEETMKVENMTSARGNKIANQFIIDDGIVKVFQSYDSVIVKKYFSDEKWEVYLDENMWNCSVTTSKYRNQFLGENKAETQRKIDAGIYELADLNS